MKKYTYTWIDTGMDASIEPLAVMLERMGQDNWEMCGVFTSGRLTRYFFKKETIEESDLLKQYDTEHI